MLTVFQNHLLPTGTDGTEVKLQFYILTWDRIYKARKAVATVILEEYEHRTGKKTRTGRKTSTGRKGLLDRMARKLSPVILNTVKDHGLAVNIPDSWSEACPVLYSQVRGGDKGRENLDSLIGLLLDMIVSPHESASSLNFGTAWQSMGSSAKPLDLDDSKLFAYKGEDMDLAKILSLLLQQDDFSSGLNSFLDAKAKDKERQAGTSSTGKKKKALKKLTKDTKVQDSDSEDEPVSSGDEGDDTTTTLTGLKQMHSKKADAVKKGVGKFIADAADTDGGGHESEYEDPFKWKDLENVLGVEALSRAHHQMDIPSDQNIDQKFYDFIVWYSGDIDEQNKNQEQDGEKLEKRIKELEDGKKKLVEEQKAKIEKQKKEKEEALVRHNNLKRKFKNLEARLEKSTSTKPISPSSPAGTANKKNNKQISPTSSSSDTANKENQNQKKRKSEDGSKNCKTTETNKKPKSRRKSEDGSKNCQTTEANKKSKSRRKGEDGSKNCQMTESNKKPIYNRRNDDDDDDDEEHTF
jgi:hypothetical protein